jgi:hypothetical protein
MKNKKNVINVTRDVYFELRLFGAENRINCLDDIILKIFSDLDKKKIDYFVVLVRGDDCKKKNTSFLLKDDAYWKLQYYRIKMRFDNFSHAILNLLRHLNG